MPKSAVFWTSLSPHCRQLVLDAVAVPVPTQLVDSTHYYTMQRSCNIKAVKNNFELFSAIWGVSLDSIKNLKKTSVPQMWKPIEKNRTKTIVSIKFAELVTSQAFAQGFQRMSNTEILRMSNRNIKF